MGKTMSTFRFMNSQSLFKLVHVFLLVHSILCASAVILSTFVS